jgi:hypothetical protein
MKKIETVLEIKKTERERLLGLVDKINKYAIELAREKKYSEYDKYAGEIRGLREELKQKYGEDLFYQSELYHALTHSTMSKEINKVLDLPGREWETFIENKAKEFGIEK